MSDREELRDILFGSGSGDDAGPLDGERAAEDAVPVAEADEDETVDLSPEELVAESIRQDREALGEVDADETAEADSEDDADADDIDDLREKARLWEAHQAQEAEREIQSKFAALQTQDTANQQKRDADKAYWTDWYMGRQLTELLERMEADAANSPNPEAYKRAHRQNIIAACRREEHLKHEGADATYKKQEAELIGQAQQLAAEIKATRDKPAYADFLMSHPELDLPVEDLRIREQILLAADGLAGDAALASMTRRAREIAWSVKFLKERAQQLTQAAAEVKGREIKLSQPHPSNATSKPRRAKPVQYAQSGPERTKQLAAILS